MLEDIVKNALNKYFDSDEGIVDSFTLMNEDNMTVLSDIRCKCIKDIISKDTPYTSEDFAILSNEAGPDENGNTFNDLNDDMSDNLIDAYANHIYNFIYKYKDEAKLVDSNINTDTEHIGPMAQDIEKVNPACVNETQDGIKVVDAGRLAMMNAGVIADLARKLNQLEEKIQ